MCKITKKQLFVGDSPPYGLLQIQNILQINDDLSTNNSSQISDNQDFLSNEGELEYLKNKALENEILEWFKEKSINAGNPDDFIREKFENKKRIILPKKLELKSSSCLLKGGGGLLARRACLMKTLGATG